VLTGSSANAVATGAAFWYCSEIKCRSVAPCDSTQEIRTLKAAAKLQLEKSLQEQNELTRKLSDAHAKYADLREVVQVHDLYETKKLNDDFKDLNLSIETVCSGISDWIMDCFDPKRAKSSLIAWGKLKNFAPCSLISSDFTADELVFTLLRFHVSQKLCSSLMRFHPRVSDVQDLIAQYYKFIRDAGELFGGPCSIVFTLLEPEPQENTARWRSWTYRAIERLPSSGSVSHIGHDSVKQHQSSKPNYELEVKKNAAAWAKTFAFKIRTEVIQRLLEIFTSDCESQLTPEIMHDLEHLAEDAYFWNDNVNTSVFSRNFHPYIFPFDEKFNLEMMETTFVGGGKAKKMPKKIIASVGLGLKSSKVKGPQQLEEMLHIKVPVVAANI
jgi:hypothetical protein